MSILNIERIVKFALFSEAREFLKSQNLKYIYKNWNNESKCLARTETITNLFLPLAESTIVQADGVLNGEY